MTIFIHVGYHRTGTSWLQNNIFPNHPKINFWDPSKSDYSWLKEIATTHDLDFDAKKFCKKYRENKSKKSNEIIGISWERFSGHIFEGAYDSARNAHRLHEVFPEAKIVIFIRNQLDMIKSMYKLYIMIGGSCTVDQFINLKYSTDVDFHLQHLCYDKLLDHYQNLFGENSLYVSMHEILRNSPQACLDDMFKFVGLEPYSFDDEIFQTESNVGLSYISLRMMRLLNRFVKSRSNPAPVISFIKSRSIRRILQGYIDPILSNHITSNSNLLEKELETKLRGYFGKSNRKLMEEYNLPLEKYNYPLD